MQKKMRDKLIELLSGKSIDTVADVEYVVDELIANGVILPTVKVGTSVYMIYPDDCGADCIAYCGNCADARWKILEREFAIGMSDLLDKTVFLTREEAERKLEEMKNNETTH